MTVRIPVEAETRRAEQNLAKVTNSVKSLETTANNTARNIRRAFIGIGAVITANFSISSIGRISTEFTNLQNRIAIVTGRTKELGKAQRELLRISERTRLNLNSTTETFGILGRSGRQFGAQTKDVLTVTENIAKAIAVSGQSAESARSAIIQLGQGLGAGTLRGQELLAVLEQATPVAEAIARGLDVPLGKLKELGEQGQLTSEQVFEALLSQTKQIDREFQNVNPTIEQSKNLLIDGVKIYVDQLDKGLGLSARVGQNLLEWSKSVRAASENAFELGTRIAFSFNIIKRDVKNVISPFVRIIKDLGIQFLNIIPKGFLTITLEGQINESIRAFDRLLGGPIAAFKRFKFIDVIRIESDVELAIRNLRRLSPKYWAAAGFDVPTIRQLFSRDNFELYINGFRRLADAVESNTKSIASTIRQFVIDVRFGTLAALRFLGLLPDTLLVFKVGNLKSFSKTIIEILRGVSNTSLEFFRIGRIIDEVLFPNLLDVFDVLADIIRKFYNSLNESSILSSVKGLFASFGQFIINIFKNIYDKIIGNSYWTDTVEGLPKLAKENIDKALKAFNNFGKRLTALFKNIARAVSENWKNVVVLFLVSAVAIGPLILDAIGYWVNFVSRAVALGLESLAVVILSGLIKLPDDLPDVVTNVIEKLGGSIATALIVTAQGFRAYGFIIKKVFNILSNILLFIEIRIILVLNKIAKKIASFIKSISLDDIKDLFKELPELVSNGLSKATDSIKSFGLKTIDVFRNIYDKVIGNSYWTDTIESIVNSSNTLWNRVSKGLLIFKENVTNIFRDIFNTRKEDRLSKILDTGRDLIPGLQPKGFASGFIEEIQEVFAYIQEKFPFVVTGAFIGIGGLIASLLFPAGSIKTAILTGVTLSLIKVGTILTEKLSNSVLDASIVNQLALNAGEAVGVFFASIIRDLPSTLSIVFGAISNFFRGVIEQIPLLGTALKGVFNIADVAGLAGALGLFGVFLFGKYTIGTISKIAKAPLATITRLFVASKAAILGQSSGILSQYVFGPLGPTRSLALIGIALDQLGLFESLFRDSALTQTVIEGGLLYLLVTGGKGVSTIADFIGKKVIFPLGSKLAILAAKTKVGTTLFDIFFGVTGNFGDRAVSAVRKVIGSVSDKITTLGAKGVQFAVPFISRFLFGREPGATKDRAKNELGLVFDVIRDSLAGFIRRVRQTNIAEAIFSFGNPAQIFDPIKRGLISFSTFFTNTLGKMRKASLLFAGPDGIVGKAIFGKAGKAALITGIIATLAIFSSSVKAASDEVPSDGEKGGFFSGIFDSLAKLANENPLTATLIPATIIALIAFRRQVLRLILSAFPSNALKGFETSSLKSIKNVGKIFRSVIGGLVGTFVGAELGRRIGPEFEIIGAIAGAALGEGIFRGLGRALASSFVVRIGGAILAAILSVKAAIVAAIASLVAVTGGLLYVLFFGETGNFSKDLDSAINKIKNFFGFGKDASKEISTGISEAAEAFANFERIRFNFSLEGIDPEQISEREQGKLDSRIAELNETILRARDEQEETGKISTETLNAINALDRGLTRFTDKLKERSEIDFEGTTNLFKKFEEFEPVKFGEKIVVGLRQSFLDFSFFLKEISLKIKGFFGSETADSELEDLTKLKDTLFSATFRNISPGVKEIIKLREDLNNTKGLDADIVERINNGTKDLLNVLEIIQRESNFLGFETPLEEDNKFLVLREVLVKRLKKTLEEALVAQQRLVDVKEFRNTLTQISRGLNEVGVSFDASKLFLDETDFNTLIDLAGNAATIAAERLKGVANTDELTQLNLRSLDIQREAEKLIQRGETASLKVQAAAAVLLSKIGEDTFSENTIEKLSKDTANKIVDLVEKIQGKEQQIKLEVELDTDLAKFQIRRLTNEVANLRTQISNIVLEEGGFDALNEFADKFGIDFNNALRQFDLSFILSEFDRLQNILKRIRVVKDKDPKQAALLRKEFDLLVANLNIADKTINEILSDVSSLGVSFNLDDFANIDSNTLNKLKEVSDELREINLILSRQGKDISDDEVRAAVQRRAKLIGTVNKIEIDQLFNTADKAIKSLGAAGATVDIIPFINDAALERLLESERTIARINQKLKSTENASVYKQLAEDLSKAKKEADSLSRKQLFSESFERFQLSDLENFSKTETVDIVLKAFPLLQDFKSLIEELPFQDLRALLADAIKFNARVDRADLGVETFTLADRTSFQRRGGGAVTEQLSEDIFGIDTRGLANIAQRKIKQETINLVSSVNKVYIDSLLRDIIAEQDRLRIPGLSEESRIAAQNLINQKSRELDLAIQRASLDVGELAFEAGQSLVDALVNGLNGALYRGVIGIKEEGKSTWTTFRDVIVNTFTEELIRPVVDGITEAIRNSGALDALADIGSELFSTFFAAIASAFSKQDSLGGTAGLGSLVGFFSAADGGPVVGPGTGTSDSIPSMLSNGEFVINASATKRNRALLEAINNNRLPKYASGGIVGIPSTSSINPAKSNSLVSDNSKSQQIFNINVTGDISRQTKSEIFRMLPEISKGVNSYNYEKRLA